jgi:hypothetical protein
MHFKVNFFLVFFIFFVVGYCSFKVSIVFDSTIVTVHRHAQLCELKEQKPVSHFSFFHSQLNQPMQCRIAKKDETLAGLLRKRN